MSSEVDGGRQHYLIPHGRPEEAFGLSGLGVSPEGSHGSMPLGPWVREADGRLAVGALGVLVDNVLAQAVLEERPADRWAVTTELALDFFTEPAPGGEVSISGARRRVLDEGGGAATGCVVDAEGSVIASATFWGRFVDGVPEPVRRGSRAPALTSRPSSIDDLVGLAGPEHERVLPQRPATVNPLGMMHGGVLVAALERAAVDGGARPHGMVTASLRVDFLRPASGDQRLVVRQIHRGRTFASAEVSALRHDGKVTAWALLTFRDPAR